MGAQIMKRSGWDLKKIKRIETDAEQNKVCEADRATSFSCELVQIKSYCKKQEEERRGKEEDNESRGLRTE